MHRIVRGRLEWTAFVSLAAYFVLLLTPTSAQTAAAQEARAAAAAERSQISNLLVEAAVAQYQNDCVAFERAMEELDRILYSRPTLYTDMDYRIASKKYFQTRRAEGCPRVALPLPPPQPPTPHPVFRGNFEQHFVPGWDYSPPEGRERRGDVKVGMNAGPNPFGNLLSIPGSFLASVATDSSEICTFGSGLGSPVAFVPISTEPPNGPVAPFSPQDSPAGGPQQVTSAPPDETPKRVPPPVRKPEADCGPPGCGAKVPPTGDVPKPPESHPSRAGGLAVAAEILLGTAGKSSAEIEAPQAPPTASVLDNIDGLLEILKRERQGGQTTSTRSDTPSSGANSEQGSAPEAAPQTATPGGTLTGPAGTLFGPKQPGPRGLPAAGVESGGEYAPSPGASLESMPTPGGMPKTDATKPAWESPNAWPTELPKTGASAPPAGTPGTKQDEPQGGKVSSSLLGPTSGAALSEILAGRDSPLHGGRAVGVFGDPPEIPEVYPPYLSSEPKPPRPPNQQASGDKPASGAPPAPAGDASKSPTSAELDAKLEQWIRDRYEHKWSGLTPMEKLMLYYRLRQGLAPPGGQVDPQGGPVVPEPKESILEELDDKYVPGLALVPPGATPAPFGIAPAAPALQVASAETVSVFFKLHRTQVGETVGPPVQQGQLQIATAQTPDLPPARTRTASDAASDRGFSANPARCTTNKNGDCSVAFLAEDRELYGFPGTGSQFAAVLSTPEHSGVVFPVSGKARIPDFIHSVSGAQIEARQVSIGGVNFFQADYRLPGGAGQTVEALNSLVRSHLAAHGVSSAVPQINVCRNTAPGPWIKDITEATAVEGDGLPGSRITLRTARRGATGAR